MPSTTSLSFSLIVVIIIIFLMPVFVAILIQILISCSFYKQDVDLVIGILSSRYNFIQRETIRKTWLNHSGSFSSVLKFKSFFIVGDEDCEIPIEDRISLYDCSRISLNSSLIQLPHLNLVQIKKIGTSHNCAPAFVGLSFQVMFDVILTKVGCAIVDGKSCREVELVDVFSRRVILKEKMGMIDDDHGPGNHDDAVLFFNNDVRPALLLPKGFTGFLISRYHDEQQQADDLCSNLRVDWDTSGLLSYLKSYRRSDGFPSESFSPNHLSLVSFEFHVSDLAKTIDFISRADQRYHMTQSQNMLLKQKLEQEIQNHPQEIVVVPVLESYRNLPDKLLQFIHWTQTVYSLKYLLKTDDDCIIDIESVIESLVTNPLNEKSWWGNFRKYWPLDEYGKWAEMEYVSVTYPPFACGSGYVIGKSLINYLADNRLLLHSYQGEDVSLGIWLTPLKPDIRSDSRWLCSKADLQSGSRQRDFISVPDLTPEVLENTWNLRLGNNNWISDS